MAVLVLTAFTLQGGKQKFGEIDVERINIVEKDGKLRMVISNQERQHPGIADGKINKRNGPRPPGILFFDQSGDEMGGLLFGANGGQGHFGSLTFDKVKNNETIGFRHLESDNGSYETGLEMWQQPDLPLDVMLNKVEAVRRLTDAAARKEAIQQLIDRREVTTQRLFLGKQRDNSTVLTMSDIKGRPRIKMMVTEAGTPRLDFLDEQGKVIYSLPELNKVDKK
jgi:hypothetical protein